MSTLEINVNMDTVEIEGRVIGRPVHITRSAWVHFWERVKYLGSETQELGLRLSSLIRVV